jgi:hypothetical protein
MTHSGPGVVSLSSFVGPWVDKPTGRGRESASSHTGPVVQGTTTPRSECR